MAIFKLNRVNATKWDLKQDQMKAFEDMRSEVIALGRYNILRDAVLVNLIMDHGTERAQKLVTAFLNRSFMSLARLQDLVDGTEPFEFKAPARVNEMPGQGRAVASSETRPLADLLGDKPAKKPAPKLGNGIMREDEAAKHLSDRSINIECLTDYFDHYGRGKDGFLYYQLKPEYR